MAQAATYVDDARSQLETLRTAVAATIVGSGGGWNTDAATAFRTLMDQWNTDCSVIVRTLDETREKLVGTRTNLSSAMDTEATGVTQITSILGMPQ